MIPGEVLQGKGGGGAVGWIYPCWLQALRRRRALRLYSEGGRKSTHKFARKKPHCVSDAVSFSHRPDPTQYSSGTIKIEYNFMFKKRKKEKKEMS